MRLYQLLLIADGNRDNDLLRQLREAGYSVEYASCQRSIKDRLAIVRPDLVVLDSRSAWGCTLSQCRELRLDVEFGRLPRIVVADRGTEADAVLALEIGADDYVEMPIGIAQLCARISAVLRRLTGKAADETIVVDERFQILHGRAAITVDGASITLTREELELLVIFAQQPDAVLTRETILRHVDRQRYANPRAVDLWVAGLRRKLQSRRGCIETVRGSGYRFRRTAGAIR